MTDQREPIAQPPWHAIAAHKRHAARRARLRAEQLDAEATEMEERARDESQGRHPSSGLRSVQ